MVAGGGTCCTDAAHYCVWTFSIELVNWNEKSRQSGHPLLQPELDDASTWSQSSSCLYSTQTVCCDLAELKFPQKLKRNKAPLIVFLASPTHTIPLRAPSQSSFHKLRRTMVSSGKVLRPTSHICFACLLLFTVLGQFWTTPIKNWGIQICHATPFDDEINSIWCVIGFRDQVGDLLVAQSG